LAMSLRKHLRTAVVSVISLTLLTGCIFPVVLFALGLWLSIGEQIQDIPKVRRTNAVGNAERKGSLQHEMRPVREHPGHADSFRCAVPVTSRLQVLG
jgi:hypothetical protein